MVLTQEIQFSYDNRLKHNNKTLYVTKVDRVTIVNIRLDKIAEDRYFSKLCRGSVNWYLQILNMQ